MDPIVPSENRLALLFIALNNSVGFSHKTRAKTSGLQLFSNTVGLSINFPAVYIRVYGLSVHEISKIGKHVSCAQLQ